MAWRRPASGAHSLGRECGPGYLRECSGDIGLQEVVCSRPWAGKNSRELLRGKERIELVVRMHDFLIFKRTKWHGYSLWSCDRLFRKLNDSEYDRLGDDGGREMRRWGL